MNTDKFSQDDSIKQSLNLKVLCFNANLKSLDFDNMATDQRASLIPAALSQEKADIIFLQEVWSYEFQTWFIEQMVRQGYTYHAVCNEDMTQPTLPSNGLMIFSKLPLEPDVQFVPWQTHTTLFDKQTNKGALIAYVQASPSVERLILINALTSTKHLDRETLQFNQNHVDIRMRQLELLTEIVRNELQKDPTAKIILALGLNSDPLKWHADTKALGPDPDDEFQWLNDKLNLSNPLVNKDFVSIIKNYDPRNNVWAARSYFNRYTPPQLLDHFFVSSDDHLTIQDVRLALTDHYILDHNQDIQGPLSDHYGIRLHLNWPIN